IKKFTSNGNFVLKFGAFAAIGGIALDRSGNIYAVVYDIGNIRRILKFTSNGSFIKEWWSSGSGNGQFIMPHQLGIDSSGNIYVGDSGDYTIKKFNSNESFITEWGSQGSEDGQFAGYIYGIAFDSFGDVYVIDSTNCRIQKFTPDGKFLTKWGSQGNGYEQFGRLADIAIDISNNIYVVDIGKDCIFKFRISN
ncbi:6-bladed beta-propeller, partial [Acidobacteriota bacterium]